MRIAMDMQACQTRQSATRGIGRYSLGLTQGLAQLQHSHDLRIALNGNYEEAGKTVQSQLASYLNQTAFSRYYYSAEIKKDYQQAVAERLISHHFTQLQPDIIHVASLFEGCMEQALVSSELLNIPHAIKAVTLYDLIPLLFKQHYLDTGRSSSKEFYYKQLALLEKFDLIFAISEATRQDAIHHLNIAPEKIIAIGGGIDSQFVPMKLTTVMKTSLREKYHLKDNFILYTGGIDFRKNLQRLIAAYANLPLSIRESQQLVIVCKCSDVDKKRLLVDAQKFGVNNDEIVFTGFVSDEELVAFYNLCTLFIFPSLYEGFGLPIVEAMACGAATIAANTSSMAEIIDRQDALFDPNDVVSITDAMQRALTNKDFLNELKHYGLQRAQEFTWEKSAKRVLTAYEEAYKTKQQAQLTLVSARENKERIAFFSPLPEQASGIADYSAKLLPELAIFFDIDLYVEDIGNVNHELLGNNFNIFSYHDYPKYHKDYSTTIYQMGNSHFHFYMYEMLSKYPGVVVLHDFFLSESMLHMTLGRTDKLEALVAYAHGDAIAKRISADDDSRRSVMQNYPINKHVLNNALGIIFHSPFCLQLMRKYYPDMLMPAINIIKQPCLLPQKVNADELRAQFGFTADEILICSFGGLGKTKLNERLFEAFTQLPEEILAKAKLIYVGQSDSIEAKALMKAVKASAYKQQIVFTDRVNKEQYHAYLQIADIAVQLRTHTRGETSAAVLDCLSYAIPTIVNAYAAFNDYPEDVVYKISETAELDALQKALQILCGNAELRSKIGENATSYINTNHEPQMIAKQYAQAIAVSIERHEASSEERLLEDLGKIINSNVINSVEIEKIALDAVSNEVLESTEIET